MPLHHYLPATFLANFSVDTETNPRRKRVIFQGDKETKKIKEVAAENVGAINNLYTLLDNKKEPEIIDAVWKDYEIKIHTTIPRLIVGYDLDAITWIRLLVPFVTCMLVRGPDFNIRFENRINSLLGENKASRILTKDNINRARIIELQRLLFPITASKWIVINTVGEEPLLTNDLGYSPFFHPKALDYGFAIPLNTNHILAISPRKYGEILHFFGNKWRPVIHYRNGAPGNHMDLNLSIATMAQRFIFGPTEEVVRKYLFSVPAGSQPIEPTEMGLMDGFHLLAYEFTWHRLAIFLERNRSSTNATDEFPLDFQYLQNGWNPPIFTPSNPSKFPAPLVNSKQSIRINLYDPNKYI